MKKIWISSALIVFALATSCKKEEVIPTPDPTTKEDGTALKNFYSQNLNELKQTFTVDASIGATLICTKGTKITIFPNSLLNGSGQTVSGNVTVELIEIYDRATMILGNKPTMGRLPNGDIAVSAEGKYMKVNIERIAGNMALYDNWFLPDSQDDPSEIEIP